MVKENILSTTM